MALFIWFGWINQAAFGIVLEIVLVVFQGDEWFFRCQCFKSIVYLQGLGENFRFGVNMHFRIIGGFLLLLSYIFLQQCVIAGIQM